MCIRVWDTLMAYGTKFIFNVTLSILKLLKNQLIELEFSEINDFFRELKDDRHLDQKLLPPYETIIAEAQKIFINEERIKNLFEKHQQKKKAPKKKEIRKTITLPPKP
jgi:ABC-type siderophore export system fused ATPase/permease subunit